MYVDMLENNINDPILNLEINTTSQLLKSILKKHQTDYVSVGDLLESFNTGGFFLLILISALLVTIPTPLSKLFPIHTNKFNAGNG